MDDGNGSFCVKAYKKSSLPKVPTREQLHRNYIRSRWEEKIVAEHMKMNYNKVQYEKTIYVSRETLILSQKSGISPVSLMDRTSAS